MKIEFNNDQCVACGLCVKDCAFHALAMVDGRPTLTHSERCMHCQHCFAICPVGAITFEGIRPADVQPIKGLPLPTAEETLNYMRARRSMRHFQPRDVESSALESILKALANTPTGCNARALTFTCFATRASLDGFRADFLHAIEQHRDGTKLLPRWLAVPAIQMRKGKSDIFFRNAAGLLMVSSDTTAPGVTTPQEDVAVAISNFEWLAQAHGIATCWFGFLKLVQAVVPGLLEKTLGIRAGTPFYAILFGYPAVSYARTVQRDHEAKLIWK